MLVGHAWMVWQSAWQHLARTRLLASVVRDHCMLLWDIWHCKDGRTHVLTPWSKTLRHTVEQVRHSCSVVHPGTVAPGPRC
jgi:hypothetical protein